MKSLGQKNLEAESTRLLVEESAFRRRVNREENNTGNLQKATPPASLPSHGTRFPIAAQQRIAYS
jgi:hypothetical protein